MDIHVFQSETFNIPLHRAPLHYTLYEITIPVYTSIMIIAIDC